ncbi:glycine--tRNA ligase subunit beta [Senegalimassilia anaerobia]|uniref:Glycine--tRNA ligase beta subunit n=1 Tax=Senegalimassilia anaerobia TaxID=1473216 RepID=A0A369LCV2_9ACTN|nr:glycine--tRNA ligase subunit beta [Senegalimassilia anaerobia]RDB56046.1 glycine--tRNA ligase subunit beta [Senegalimassilia anaerobia]
MADKHTLAFEIGVEEIPAFDLDSANKQLEKMVPAAFADARIPYDSIEIHSSPRRLIVMAYGVADATEALVEEYKGPAAKIAFDADGNPTKAAIGFARGKGLSPENLERREVNGTEYVFATKNIPATPVADLLPDVLAGFITAIKWPRSCRWAAYREYFVRPVRWIVAMLDDVVLPVSFAGAESSNFTMGHRVLAPGKHTVDTAANLLDVIRAAYVIPTQAERERIIREGVAAIEAETGFTADLPAKTLLEVVNLSEYPQPLVSTFDEEFLQVPEEIIVDAMLMHQRYFPLYDAAGKLTNKFIIVSNGNPECAATIIDGNERVVRARLDDAKFFYEEDLKHPLESYIEKLDKVVFQESLGTVRQKAERLEKLACALSADAQLDAADAADAKRAARLCKADLVTNAVIEFTSVQGVMGSYYAAASGETPQVAQAIGQHYQPRFAGDALPDTTVGKLVALADKLDTICGLFAVGQGPTGSSDPFALRRSAIGIVNMLEAGLPISLAAAIDESLASFAAQGVAFDAAAVRAEVVDFFVTRTKVMLRDAGVNADTIDAVLAAGVEEPAVISQRAHALEDARANDAETFDNLATAYARANNLRKPELGEDVDDALLTDPERALAGAVATAEQAVAAALESDDFAAALSQLAALRAPIDGFFADVMVMDEDAALRDNRLRLLNRFVAVFANVADFGKMAKSK